LLSKHFSLLSILIGSALFTFTVGPFQNWDTGYEYAAASGVLKWGVPYTGGAGSMINQPPLGFYIDSTVFRVFGLSFNTGVAIITCFGLGCILLVYLIGKAWYGKTTGLLASALFAVTPWQVVFSRSFLIDVQCLFFSLLFLLIGFYAIRKDSLGLFMLSGVFLGVAFLTKFYAIFMLFPLAIFYFYHRRKSLWNPLVVLAFFLPVVVLLLIWYQGICQINILTIFSQDDFKFYNTAGSMPSYFFTFNYLIGNLGMYFLAAIIISLLVSTFQRKIFRNILAADLVCMATILLVLGIDTFLALGLNFRAPYTGAVKYDYQSLPFFCLLAGSLLSKCQSLFTTVKMKLNRSWLFFGTACLGAVSLVIAIFSNFYYVNLYSQLNTVAFTEEGQVSYSFSNSAQIIEPNSLVYVQYIGFALLLSGLIWAVKDKLTKKSPVPDLR
jgi:4-amino-4-deoxy-L-arabinose transferase-like glycosyltransferase